MIHSKSEAMRPGRRLWPHAILIFAAAAALPSFAACSSTCHRLDLARSVLDEQNVMLAKLKIERADPRVAVKVQADSDLQASEEYLNRVIEMLMRSSIAVKTAL